MLGQQRIGAVEHIAQPFQHLALEAAIQRQLYVGAEGVLLREPAHHRAQCLRRQRQRVGLECRRRRQHAQPLPEQVQGIGRAQGFAPDHLGQQQVAVDVMLGHQRQPQHAGQRRRGGPGGGCSRRLAQACQGLGNGIQHPVGEVTGKGMQLSALGHQFGLLQRIARAIGVVQQGLFQRLDGQDQRRGQGLPAQADQRAQQFAHPRRQVGCGQAGLVGRGGEKTADIGERYPDSRGSIW